MENYARRPNILAFLAVIVREVSASLELVRENLALRGYMYLDYRLTTIPLLCGIFHVRHSLKVVLRAAH